MKLADTARGYSLAYHKYVVRPAPAAAKAARRRVKDITLLERSNRVFLTLSCGHRMVTDTGRKSVTCPRCW